MEIDSNIPQTILIVAIVDALFQWGGLLSDTKIMVRLTKCVFCICMMLFIFFAFEDKPIMLMLGQFFSLLGDFFLLFQGNIFLVGMLSFAIAHICNFFAFVLVSVCFYSIIQLFIII